MSLILEALKKSEAERRLGRTPDLLTPMPRRAPARRSGLWGFGIGLAVAAALAAAAWWWFAVSGTGETMSATPAPVEEAPQAPAPVVPPPTANPPPAPPAPATQRARPAAEVIAHAPLPQDPDFAGTERESVAVPAGAIPLSTPATPAATPAPVPPPQPPAPPAPAPQPAAPPAPALEALPHLAMLPASEREGLPPLRLSMHVYDPDPAARFVLIDGRRYRQGDSLAEGLTLETIRPDGVAMAYHGRRFLVSRP